MPQSNTNRQAEGQVRDKVQADTDERLARFQAMRRDERVRQARNKIKVQVDRGEKGDKKELRMGEDKSSPASAFHWGENLSIGLVLGMTLALVNDFSDLVTWQKTSLIAQTIDITTLVLLLFVLMFSSRAYFISIFIIIVAFLLELLPVSGVLPYWTIGMGLWYIANRNRR